MSKFKRIIKKIVFNKITYTIYRPFALLFGSHQIVDDPLKILHSYYEDQGLSAIVDNGISDEKKFNLAIIIPCYNCEKYIDECLNSIINQNIMGYTYEIIAIDDGSKDKTALKLSEWKEKIPNITIIHQQNKGAAAARNAGIKVAKADYLMFVDADDVLKENSITTLLTKAYSAHYDIVQGGFLYFFNDNLKEIRKSKDNSYLNGLPCGKVYKSALFSRIYFPENYWFEDTNNVFLIFREAKNATIIDDVIFYYRQHKDNTSNQNLKNPRRLETIYVTLKMIEDYEILYKEKDQFLFDTFLGQIFINFCRTKHLDKQCKKAIFALYCYIYDSIGLKEPTNKKYKDLVKSFETRNYSLFNLFLLAL